MSKEQEATKIPSQICKNNDGLTTPLIPSAPGHHDALERPARLRPGIQAPAPRWDAKPRRSERRRLGGQAHLRCAETPRLASSPRIDRESRAPAARNPGSPACPHTDAWQRPSPASLAPVNREGGRGAGLTCPRCLGEGDRGGRGAGLACPCRLVVWLWPERGEDEVKSGEIRERERRRRIR